MYHRNKKQSHEIVSKIETHTLYNVLLNSNNMHSRLFSNHLKNHTPHILMQNELFNSLMFDVLIHKHKNETKQKKSKKSFNQKKYINIVSKHNSSSSKLSSDILTSSL